MLSSFTLLTLFGVSFRLAFSWLLITKFSLRLAIPQSLAGACLVLACLPSWLQPFAFPLPLGFVVGFLLPDVLLDRRAG
jgi:hypothetical protein